MKPASQKRIAMAYCNARDMRTYDKRLLLAFLCMAAHSMMETGTVRTLTPIPVKSALPTPYTALHKHSSIDNSSSWRGRDSVLSISSTE